MWQIFGAGGVAIESTVEKVLNALDPKSAVQAKLVEYVDYPKRPATDLDPVRVLSFKRPPYEHENELRFFVSLSEEAPHLIRNLRESGESLVHLRPEGQLGPHGITVPLDVIQAVDRVVLAPRVPNWLKNAVFQLCVANKIEMKKVEESTLDYDPDTQSSGLNKTRLGCDELAR
jgi:hypothetical protein